MKTTLRVTLVCTLLFMFLPACTSTRESPIYTPVPTVVEPGLAYGEPCKPPCWRGIIPGKTTKPEADRAMEQLRSSGWASYVSEGPKGYITYPLSGTIVGAITVMFENDVISNVVGQVNFSYSVETMIEQFGEPKGFYTGDKITATTSCEEWKPSNPQTYSWGIEAIYPSKGLAFGIPIPQGGRGLMCPQWEVGQFCYYPPLSLQEALDKDFLANLCGWGGLKGLTEQKLVKWHGFGSGY